MLKAYLKRKKISHFLVCYIPKKQMDIYALNREQVY